MSALTQPLFQFIDLNKIVAQNNDCLMIRVTGAPDADVPIVAGDWVLIDRSLSPSNGHVVLFRRGECYTIQRYSAQRDARKLRLVTPNFTPERVEVLGVVTMVIHPMVR